MREYSSFLFYSLTLKFFWRKGHSLNYIIKLTFSISPSIFRFRFFQFSISTSLFWFRFFWISLPGWRASQSRVSCRRKISAYYFRHFVWQWHNRRAYRTSLLSRGPSISNGYKSFKLECQYSSICQYLSLSWLAIPDSNKCLLLAVLLQYSIESRHNRSESVCAGNCCRAWSIPRTTTIDKFLMPPTLINKYNSLSITLIQKYAVCYICTVTS